MESIGLSMAMGAFAAGLLIADSSYRHQIIAEIQPFRGLLLGLFFMSMGMSLNLTLFFANPLVLLGIVVAFNCWEVPHSLAFVTCVWHTEHDIGFDSFTPGSKW